MTIEQIQLTDMLLEELIRQSLQEQMTRAQPSPAVRERIWRRVMASAACDGKESFELND